MRLARELSMTRAELRLRMSSAEFTDWIAFYTLESEDQERAIRKAQRHVRA